MQKSGWGLGANTCGPALGRSLALLPRRPQRLPDPLESRRGERSPGAGLMENQTTPPPSGRHRAWVTTAEACKALGMSRENTRPPRLRGVPPPGTPNPPGWVGHGRGPPPRATHRAARRLRQRWCTESRRWDPPPTPTWPAPRPGCGCPQETEMRGALPLPTPTQCLWLWLPPGNLRAWGPAPPQARQPPLKTSYPSDHHTRACQLSTL